MSEFKSTSQLEAAIVRVAFYYCQLRELADTIGDVLEEDAVPDNLQEVKQRYMRAQGSAERLYGELQRLTQHLSDAPPSAPRVGPTDGLAT